MSELGLMDISNVPEFERNLLDNYVPNYLDGKIIKGIDKEWNPKNWHPRFIVSEDLDLRTIVILTCAYDILQNGESVVSGQLTYNVKTGELYSVNAIFVDDSISKDDIEKFLQHLIICFGATNYLEKCIAMKKALLRTKSEEQTNSSNSNLHDIARAKIISRYEFQDKLTPEIYIPTNIDVKKIANVTKDKTTKNTKKPNKKNGIDKEQIVKVYVYKVAKWPYHGYYRSDGTYIPPGYKHRIIPKEKRAKLEKKSNRKKRHNTQQ